MKLTFTWLILFVFALSLPSLSAVVLSEADYWSTVSQLPYISPKIWSFPYLPISEQTRLSGSENGRFQNTPVQPPQSKDLSAIRKESS